MGRSNRPVKEYDDRVLYRIFYYDCPPIAKTVYHPLLKLGIEPKAMQQRH